MSPYQEGYIELRKRKRLPNLYELHYRKYMADGSYTHEREMLGTVKELPTKKALMDKAAEVRARINAEPKGVFFRDVAARYKVEHIKVKLRPRSQVTAEGFLVYRMWSEEECRVMINASLCKLIDDAGGLMTIAVSDMFRVAQKGTLAMSLSDDDKVLTLTRVKES
ncbi:MAG: hypothetical protein KGL39_36335 [Patescibacteria group bacterium]|nr:hypothetical protein [Patescibacteria group bacterium]